MANSDINNGAQYLASLNLDGNQLVRLRSAARQMGISEQEAARLISRADKKLRRKGGGDDQVGRVVDQIIRRAAGVEQINQEMPGDIDQYRSVPNNQVQQAEEGNQDQLQNFGGRDGQGNIKDLEQQLKEMAGAEGRVDPNVIKRSRWDKAKGEFVVDEFYAADGVPIPADFQEAAKQKDFGLQVPNAVAPAQQVMREELVRLQEGIDKFGADAFPGGIDPQRGVSEDVPGVIRNNEVAPLPSGVAGPNAPGARLGRPYVAQIPGAAGIAGQLEDQLYGGRGAQQALVRELVQKDRLRQNAAQVEANNWRAQAAANVIGQDFVAGGRGAAADQAMENIGNIAQLGPAKVGYDFQVSNNPVDRGTAIPDALPLNLPDQYNAPATDNRFAGPLQRQEQWLADNAPGYKKGNAFGDYPQVAIGQQLGAAQAAIEGINFGTKDSPRNLTLGQGAIRNLNELQAAVDQAASFGQQEGVKFYDYRDGKNVYVANPGISEVLQKGGMNENQRRDVARALFAEEAARRNPANQVAKNFYQAGMGQPGRPVEFGGNHPDLGGGMVQIALLGGEKIKGKEVRGQLQALTGRVGNDTPLDAGELADARMPMIGGVAGQDIPRAAFVRAPVMGPGPTRLMSEDQVYERFGPVNGQIANAVIQRFEQAQGTNPDGFGMRVERQRNMDPGPRFDPGPDPWSQPVGTGNGINEERERRMSKDMLNTLAELNSGPAQGPVPGSARKQFTDQARNFGKSPKYERANRYGRRSAIAGGGVAALAGIDGLINGERNKREEEQYR